MIAKSPHRTRKDMHSPQTNTMFQVANAVASNQRTILWGFAVSILLYFFIMDSLLYTRFKTVDLVKESKMKVTAWSPFHPLSVKLLMSDHASHYILTPLSEYFDEITKFSKVFYFVTPNMITYTHLILGFIMSRFFIYSDSLKTRRIGVLLCQFRFFLDALDGTVYRSQSANTVYKSNHSNLGFWVDSVSDTAVGFFYCFAILFHFYWKCPPVKETPSLPWYEDDQPVKNVAATENHVAAKTGSYSKLFIFWRVFCFGSMIGISSAFWDQLHTRYTAVFMTKLDDSVSEIQASCFHSMTTWVIFWCWRVLQGQALTQMLNVAIFTDKIWEFLRFVQYLGHVVILILAAISFYHISYVKQLLHL